MLLNVILSQARGRKQQVTQNDLLRWVAQVREEINPARDMSSATFLTDFRRKNRISSRKINRLVSCHSLRTAEQVSEEAKAFVQRINEKIVDEALADECIWNADQSGFEYEMIRKRTLAFKGEKIVEALVTNSNAVSHSYTIQLHVSKAGKLGTTLFLCFQEPKGFGPLVQEKLARLESICPNVAVTSSTSGKFTKSIMQKWVNDVFLKDVTQKSLLILDSWPGQGPAANLTSPNLSIDYIPKGATKEIQPLDVYFFRQYKILVKDLVAHCRDAFFNNPTNPKPCNRYFLIRLHSVCFNQLHHPKFTPMLRYAWQASGYYSDNSVNTFENVKEVLLNPVKSRDAKCSVHQKLPVLKCAYCNAYICLTCFDDPIHLHDPE